jgi:mRNA-degrading endonuclease RelE of RelBE toxin-antitoxin system
MKRVIWARRATRDLERVDDLMRQRIVSAIELMATSGAGDIRRLADVKPPEFRLRVGQWRVRFTYGEAQTVVILRVLPRDKAYR